MCNIYFNFGNQNVLAFIEMYWQVSLLTLIDYMFHIYIIICTASGE